MKQLRASITKNSAILTVFALFTAGLITCSFQSTEERIKAAERKAAQAALFQIVPQTRHNNDLLNDVIPLSPGDAEKLHADPALIYVAKMDNQAIAFIVPTTAKDGYSGDIRMIVGVNIDGTLAGVRVLKHAETPGLGDKIDIAKSQWILGFDHKSLNDPTAERWAVKKDGGVFDQFAGATITPRAVINQIKTVLEFVAQRQAELLSKSQSTETQPHE
jgi:Na+-translocating ferredoxin:NAD+ oxidoreductase subunit G